jgi:hypothetical protein
VRIYARIAGPLHPALAIPAFSAHRTHDVGALVGGKIDETITYTVKNSGNVRLTPLAYLKVSPLFGSAVSLPRQQLPELLPGSSITFQDHVKDVRPFGRVHAELFVQARRNASARASTNQLVIPWILLAIVVLIIGGTVLWIRRRRRARRGGEEDRVIDLTEPVDLEAAEGETEAVTHQT